MESVEIKLQKYIEKIKFELSQYQNRNIIWIMFLYDPEIIKFVKNELKAKWNFNNKRWYVEDSDRYRVLFNIESDYYSKKSMQNISSENTLALNNLIDELQLRGYSSNTIRTYSNEFIQLLKTLKNHPVNKLSAERIRAYILYCINTLKVSDNLIHSRINALKFYFEKVLKREQFFINIPRPKKPSILPKSLSTNDIKKMFEVLENNNKHLLLIKLCYGMGLRVSEIVNLKISDIDSSRMQVLINQSKGKKDRYVNLPESILGLLRKYYIEYRPKIYLFEGRNSEQYSVRSVQTVFKNAMQKAKINKRVGVHSLRHSYATHLIEQGTDIRFVQDLLGHSDIKTTMFYTNLTDTSIRKIKSPLDNL